MTDSATPRFRWMPRLFGLLYFLVIFITIHFFIDPALIYQCQETTFFTGIRFFQDHLTYPGGIIEYLSAFLTQGFYYGWPGSLIMTLVFGLIWLMSRLILKRISVAYPRAYLAFLPAAVSLALHMRYAYPLVYTLAFLTGLVAAWLYMRIETSHGWFRVILFLIMAGILYYLSGGILLMFTVMAMLYEWIYRKQPWFSLTLLICALIIPFISFRWLFIISPNQAYFDFLPTAELNPVPWLGAVLLLLLPLLLAIAAYAFQRTRSTRLMVHAGVPVLILAVTALAWLNFKTTEKTQFQMLRLSRDRQWDPMIHLAEQIRYRTPILAIESNRALFHTHRLAEDMFSYPQMFGPEGLLVLKKDRIRYPVEKSDLMLDLGFVNESIHWASEALSSMGESPYILKQLATLYIIKKEFKTAGIYLNRLNRTLIYGKWAGQIQSRIGTDHVLDDSRFRKIRQVHFSTDHIVEAANPCLSMDHLIQQNPRNRMAVEYRLMFALLSKDMPAFAGHIKNAKINYPDLLPRHFEEALLFYIYVLKGEDLNPEAYQIRKTSVERFRMFTSIFSKAGGNRKSARPAMARYLKDTYWYYYLYQDTGHLG